MYEIAMTVNVLAMVNVFVTVATVLLDVTLVYLDGADPQSIIAKNNVQMALTAKIVPGFAQQDVTNSVIKKQVTAFVETVTGEAFVIGHVHCTVIKTCVTLIQAIVTAVITDIME
uniref:Uncharacterized protein n=1 Tax=Magallana gigas TaxID=29159 RepID=K1RRS0_MAGGI